MNSLTTSVFLGGLNAVEERYAPKELYWLGNQELSKRRPRIAVIGTRDPSESGLELARAVASMVVEIGGVVVSGLAKGIDRAAHEAAIGAGGNTIAVIATPLRRVYPREHRQLQERIAREHLLVSQFAPETTVSKGNFILRNRTMALLSHGSVIIQAGEKSGTEHQGWEAIRLGRELFLSALLMEAGFSWPRKMTEYGATIFQDAEELRELLTERLPSSDVSSASGF